MKLFHTFPTAWIWHHLTLVVCSSQDTLKGILSHVKKWFQEEPEELYTEGFKKHVQQNGFLLP